MNKTKIKRLKRVLKYEQREQDKFIQNLNAQRTKLGMIQAELEILDRRRDDTYVDTNPNSFDPEIANNRNAWSDRINQIFLELMMQKASANKKVNAAQLQVQKQKARLKSIEMLISNMLQRILQSQLQFENIELMDIVLNRNLESQR